MNGYPFAGPGGQKTLHRQAAAAPLPLVMAEERHFLATLNVFAPYMAPAQVYAEAIEFDNR